MRYIPASALGLVLLLSGTPVLFLASTPAYAQMSMGGSPGAGGGPGGGSAPQPAPVTHDVAPPALPGAGAPAPLATAPVAQKPAIADPTQALFAAVNSGDYNAAQDALSRGADLTAKNGLGETPLDLSIALNHNSITFLLLATRNETGGSATGASASGPAMPVAAPTGSKPSASKPTGPARAKPRPAVRPPAPAVQLTPGNNPGTPDPSAGFLGFAPKS